MKTKELIRQLQKADPSGEEECVVGGTDISDVSPMVGYYDGPYEHLVLDEEGQVVGAELRRDGIKVVISTYSIEDLVFSRPRIPVKCECYDVERNAAFLGRVEEWRQQSHDISNQVEREHFVKFMAEKGVGPTNSETFFRYNMSHEDPMPKDILDLRLSWNERRELQWTRELKIINGLLSKA